MGAGKADPAKQNATGSSPSTPTLDPWLCKGCYEICEDGHLKKCPSCKNFKPLKEKDKVADVPKSAISKETQKLLDSTDPNKKQ